MSPTVRSLGPAPAGSGEEEVLDGHHPTFLGMVQSNIDDVY